MNYLNYKRYGHWLEDGLPAQLSFSGKIQRNYNANANSLTAITGYQIRSDFKKIDRTVENKWNIFEYINKKLIGEFRSVTVVFSVLITAFIR